jgi:hypothetical protein
VIGSLNKKASIRKVGGAWKVKFEGRYTSPDFNSKGAAVAYADMLKRGERTPEWPTEDRSQLLEARRIGKRV